MAAGEVLVHAKCPEITINHYIKAIHKTDGFFTMANQYIVITFKGLDEAGTDLAIGLLSEIGYYGFEESSAGLSAFIKQDDFDEERLTDITRSMDIAWEKKLIEEENWNAIWERSFEPVVIPGKVTVRATFHAAAEGEGIEIIITPKMSFGTGHHATTWMMMDMMFGLDMKGKEVLDFGTGTGILAILAEKLGASRVDAIDFDPWCIENARENLSLNHCDRVVISQAEVLPVDRTYDVVLANINRNFLLENREGLVKLVRKGGRLLLSGFLAEDRTDVENAYLPLAGQPLMFQESNNWIGLTFSF
jgi:ribosomal protein L11 methyltransferase